MPRKIPRCPLERREPRQATPPAQPSRQGQRQVARLVDVALHAVVIPRQRDGLDDHLREARLGQHLFELRPDLGGFGVFHPFAPHGGELEAAPAIGRERDGSAAW